MERMCRICLVENVRMHIVVDKVLHELYETLTDIPFVTEDSRPMLACFLCYAKLKQCCQLQRKCLKAEELFDQMMNEPNPCVNRGKLACGLTLTPVENISIVDVGHIESNAVREELPAVCERLDDVIELEEELHSDDLKLENVYVNVENIPALHNYESNSEDDVPFTQVKAEVQEVPRKERRASDTTRAAIAKKQTQLGKIIEDIITENLKKKEDPVTEVTQNTQKLTSTHIPGFQEPLTNTTPRVDITVIDITSDTNCSSNIIKHNLTDHTRVRTSGGPHKCDICQYSCKKKTDLIRHIRTHTGEKPFQCEYLYCQKSFSSKGSLTVHTRIHTGEKPYECEQCQLCFSRRYELLQHIRKHTGEKPFKDEESQLLNNHTGEKPFQCEYCQKCFGSRSGLTIHIRTHTGDKPYKCEECQLCFSEKTSLLSHNCTHAGDKPDNDKESQLLINRQFNIIKKFRPNTGKRPYKCKYCQKCFNFKSTLTTHIRTHTGEKPYKCGQCQVSFSQKSPLVRHIRTHTGEKPYKCEKCQLCFIQKFNLLIHNRRNHAGEQLYK